MLEASYDNLEYNANFVNNENGDVIVTDLEDENLLVTRDEQGRPQYHPIAPIIHYKIPAREIMDRAISGDKA